MRSVADPVGKRNKATSFVLDSISNGSIIRALAKAGGHPTSLVGRHPKQDGRVGVYSNTEAKGP